jgi:hypothetical protein
VEKLRKLGDGQCLGMTSTLGGDVESHLVIAGIVGMWIVATVVCSMVL